MASQPAFTWSNTGVGSVSASGLYTAPGSGSAGAATVSAAAGAASGSAAVTVTNAAPSFATPASASPSTVTGTTTSLSALGADDGGESNLTYTWAVAGTPPAAVAPTFSANGSNAAKSTTATFSSAGTYTFRVTIADAQGLSATSSRSVTVRQTLTTVSVTPGAVTVPRKATQQFSATANDQFGDPFAAPPPFTWAVSSGVGTIDASGLYTAPPPNQINTATVTATSGGLSGSAAVTVNYGPTVATGASASPPTVSGTSTQLSVLGASVLGEPALTYTWSTTNPPPGPITYSRNGTNASKNTTATFTAAGVYDFQVLITDSSGFSTSSAVTVTVSQTPGGISVTPGSAALKENGRQQFFATALDQFGRPLASQPAFTWSITGSGSVNSTGLYTAPAAPGSATVTASSGGFSGSAPLTVTNATPTVATVATASPSPVTGTTTGLSVVGADDGGEASLTYTWAATSAPPAAPAVTFSANGTNAAKNTTATFRRAGTYSLRATLTDAGGLTTTSSVAVTVQQTLTSVSVSPATSTASIATAQAFSAVANDQFGQPLAVPTRASRGLPRAAR